MNAAGNAVCVAHVDLRRLVLSAQLALQKRKNRRVCHYAKHVAEKSFPSCASPQRLCLAFLSKSCRFFLPLRNFCVLPCRKKLERLSFLSLSMFIPVNLYQLRRRGATCRIASLSLSLIAVRPEPLAGTTKTEYTAHSRHS